MTRVARLMQLFCQFRAFFAALLATFDDQSCEFFLGFGDDVVILVQHVVFFAEVANFLREIILIA